MRVEGRNFHIMKEGDYNRVVIDGDNSGVLITDKLANNPNAVLKFSASINRWDAIILDCLEDNSVCEYEINGEINVKDKTPLKLRCDKLKLDEVESAFIYPMFGDTFITYKNVEMTKTKLGAFDYYDRERAGENLILNEVTNAGRLVLEGDDVFVKNYSGICGSSTNTTFAAEGKLRLENVVGKTGRGINILGKEILVEDAQIFFGPNAQTIRVADKLEVRGKGNESLVELNMKYNEATFAEIRGSLIADLGEKSVLHFGGNVNIEGDTKINESCSEAVFGDCDVKWKELVLNGTTIISDCKAVLPEERVTVGKFELTHANATFSQITGEPNIAVYTVVCRDLVVDNAKDVGIYINRDVIIAEKDMDSIRNGGVHNCVFVDNSSTLIKVGAANPIKECEFRGNSTIRGEVSAIRTGFSNAEIEGRKVEITSSQMSGTCRLLNSKINDSCLNNTSLKNVEKCETSLLDGCQYDNVKEINYYDATNQTIRDTDRLSYHNPVEQENRDIRFSDPDRNVMEGIEL